MFMRMLFVWSLAVFLVLISSCSDTTLVSSEPEGVRNSHHNLNSAETPASDSTLSKTVSDTCIKNNGWLVPPTKGGATAEKLDPRTVMMRTRSGKEVSVTLITYSYGYEHAWTYSQDLRCKSADQDYLEGNYATPWYTELSVNGQVFAYSIFAKEVWDKPTSTSDAGEERFTYELQDDDGDGIFETLIHGGKKMVPDWVLR